MPLLDRTRSRPGDRPRRSFSEIMRREELMRRIQDANDDIVGRADALTPVGSYERRFERSQDDDRRHHGRRPNSPRPPRPPPTTHLEERAKADNVASVTLSIDPATAASDVTVHLELNIDGNLESTLEEMSRLRRLGHFNEALTLAEVEVKPFLHNRYVLVQYAQLLMDARRYKDIARLSLDHVPVGNSRDLVELNWTMICQSVEVTTELDIIGCSRVLRGPRYEVGPLDSTWFEVCILSIRGNPSDRPPSGWWKMYKVLHRDGRVWEAHDLIEVLLESMSAEALLTGLFRASDRSDVQIEMLVEDWDTAGTGPQGESNLLALIGMLTNLALAFTQRPDTARGGLSCRRMARDAADKLVTRYGAHNIRTRPFLRHLATDAMFKAFIGPSDAVHSVSFEVGVNGEVESQDGLAFPDYRLPAYMPMGGDKTPLWAPRKRRDVLEVLHTVLDAARSMGDVALQIGCLTQLIMYGEDDAARIADELDELYLEAGDFVGRRDCLMFRYLLARTDDAKKTLHGLILESGRYVFRGKDNPRRDRVLEALEYHVMGPINNNDGSDERPLRRRRALSEYNSPHDYTDEDSDYEDRPYAYLPSTRGHESRSYQPTPSSRPIQAHDHGVMTRNPSYLVRRRSSIYDQPNNPSSYDAGPLVIYNRERPGGKHAPSYHHEDDDDDYEPDLARKRTVFFDEPEEFERRRRDDSNYMTIPPTYISDTYRHRTRSTAVQQQPHATEPTVEQLRLDEPRERSRQVDESADLGEDPREDDPREEVPREENRRRAQERRREEFAMLEAETRLMEDRIARKELASLEAKAARRSDYDPRQEQTYRDERARRHELARRAEMDRTDELDRDKELALRKAKARVEALEQRAESDLGRYEEDDYYREEHRREAELRLQQRMAQEMKARRDERFEREVKAFSEEDARLEAERRREAESRRDEEARHEAWSKDIRLRALREQARRMDAERHEAASTGEVPLDGTDVGLADKEFMRDNKEVPGDDADAAYEGHERAEAAGSHTNTHTDAAPAPSPAADVPSRRTTVDEDPDE